MNNDAMKDFTALLDLASERLGGRTLAANDEFFAPKENLLKPGRGIFEADRYTDRGKWMDGWETRRRRDTGFDWCVIRLAVPGILHGINVDTHHFRGNYPAACRVEACALGGEPALDELDKAWEEIVPQSPLAGHAENFFAVQPRRRFSHVRLSIFPDGGVARLRVHGEPAPDWARLLGSKRIVDLAAARSGGWPVASSDAFFSQPLNLLMPGSAANMGDGWETRRRRGPGHDWVVIRLGRPGVIERMVVDTSFFKGNYPEHCSLEGCVVPRTEETGAFGSTSEAVTWQEILPRRTLRPHAVEALVVETAHRPVSHVRFNIYPDGGVSRLRLYGRPAELDVAEFDVAEGDVAEGEAE